MSDQQPDYDENGIQWVPTESLYAPPDAVPQQPPTNDLSELRAAVERGDRLRCGWDETGFAPDGSLVRQRPRRYTTVIAKEVYRRDDEEGT